MSVHRQPTTVQILHDLFRLLFLGIILGLVSAAAFYPRRTQPPWIDGSARILLGLSTEILVLAVLRELVPRPSAGKHIVGTNWPCIRWLMSSAFAEVAMHPVVRCPFWLFHSTRVLYLKALGAKVSWRVGFHEHFVPREPSLLTIAPGAQLEPGVIIESALHGAGRVRISPVIIGGGCLVGAHAILMPGATLAHDATVAPGVFVGEDVHVGVGAKIGEGATLEKGVDLGSYTTVGTGAIVSEGVRVGDRARIGSGALVEPGTTIGEREIWEGAPARRVTGGPEPLSAA